MNKKYKPSSCGACKYSNIETGAEIEFICSKANREIPGTSGTIEDWCPLHDDMPKTNPQSLAGLTAEELEGYNTFKHQLESGGIMTPYLHALESLSRSREEIMNLKSDLEDYKYFVKQRNEKIARSRALLKKHQYAASGIMPGEDPYPLCPECRYDEHDGHADDCAIAAELEGVE